MSEYFEFHASRRLEGSGGGGAGCDYLVKRSTIKDHYCNREPYEQMRTLQQFKDMLGASLSYALKDKSCCLDDNFLQRFLYARKFQLDAAYNLIINYFKYLNCHRSNNNNNNSSSSSSNSHSNSALLQRLNIFDERCQMALRDSCPTVLKQRDRRGRKVLVFTAANWDPSKYGLDDVCRAFLLTLDKLLENVQNQALGFVVIVDWTNFTFKQSTHLSPKILKIMIEGLQDCIPAKFKGIHFIAQPWYVDWALTVIKPFLNDKTKKHIVIHGANLSTLHELVSKDVLPTDLGGEGHINTLDWFHYLVESSQSMEMQSNKPYRLIQTEVYSKAPIPTAIFNTTNNNTNNKDKETINSQQQQPLLNS